MANITMPTIDARVADDIIDRLTCEPAVAITAGQVIRQDTAGKWILAKATTAPLSAGCYIATRSGGPGVGLTGFRQGKLSGLDIAVAIGAAVYLSDTDGTLSDTAGTVSVLLGRIVKPGVMSVNCPT